MSESNHDALVVRLVGKSLHRPEDPDVDGRTIHDVDWSGKWRVIVNAVKNGGFHKIREMSKLAGELHIVQPPTN